MPAHASRPYMMSIPPSISVRYPKLFVGFLDEEPIFDPHYVNTRVESEDAVCSACDFSPSRKKAVQECDFAYFAAIMAPFANERKFRTICDWGNWIFPYDDLFDNGTMRSDYNQAAAAMDMLITSFDDSHKHQPEHILHTESVSITKLAHFHGSIWNSIKSSAPSCTKRRYTTAMKQYCAGTLAQVQQATLLGLKHTDDVLLRRRQSVCVLPLFALVEFAHDIDLPDEVHDRDDMRDIRALGVDIIVLHNDLISYHKEELEGVPHNMIAAYRESGKTAQEAVDLVGFDIERRSLLLERAIEQVSRWESPWQRESMRYVQGVRDVVKANLYWSLHSGRFLTDEQKIRLFTTDMVELSASPFHFWESRPVPKSKKPWSVRALGISEVLGAIPDHYGVVQQNERRDKDGRQDHDNGYFEGLKDW